MQATVGLLLLALSWEEGPDLCLLTLLLIKTSYHKTTAHVLNKQKKQKTKNKDSGGILIIIDKRKHIMLSIIKEAFIAHNNLISFQDCLN